MKPENVIRFRQLFSLLSEEEQEACVLLLQELSARLKAANKNSDEKKEVSTDEAKN